MKDPKKKCCQAPDVKNEGRVNVPGGVSWEYFCYSCGKSWTEIEPEKK